MAARISRDGATGWARVLVGIFLGAATAAAQSPSSPKPDPSWTDLARNAQVVVVARVVSVASQWEGRKIVSTARIQPLEVLKDVRTAPGAAALEVRLMGGRVGSWAQDYSHEPTLTAGETLVLFLVPARSGKVPGLVLLGEEGKVPLLRPGDSASRLKSNRRLAQRLEALRAAVKASR